MRGVGQRHRRALEWGAALLILGVVLAGAGAHHHYRSLEQALALALDQSDLPAVMRLVHRGVDVNYCSPQGMTALSLATGEGTARDVANLLKRGARPSVGTELNPPLGTATAGNDLEKARLLLDHGADPNVRFGPSYSVMANAVTYENREMVDLLVKHGARLKGDSDAMKAAVSKGKLDLLRYLIRRGGSIADVPDPLIYAASTGNLEIVRFVEAQGARLTKPTEAVCTAVQSGDVEVVRFILERGASPNGRNASGSTPLGLAAQRRRLDITRLLISRGADVNALDAEGRSPLAYARDGLGAPALIRMLKQAGARG